MARRIKIDNWKHRNVWCACGKEIPKPDVMMCNDRGWLVRCQHCRHMVIVPFIYKGEE